MFKCMKRNNNSEIIFKISANNKAVKRMTTSINSEAY